MTGATGNREEVPVAGSLKKALDGGKWYLMNVIMQKVFNFGTFFILARFLTPADFGLIAIAAIFPTIIDTLTALAFETVVVQMKKDEERPYLNAIWTYGVIRGISICTIVFLSAPFVARFFNYPQAVNLFQLSGLLLCIQGIGNVGQVYFFKNLQFEKVFFRDLSIQIATSAIAITGALYFHSYWALFAAQIGAGIVGVIASYMLNGYRPMLDIHFWKLKPLLVKSRWIYGQELLNQATLNLENILVGRFAGANDLGLLTKAKGLAQVPTSMLAAIFKEVSFSAYASVQDSQERVRNGLSKSVDLIAGVAIPFFAAIYVAGERVISLLLGQTWTGITPLLYIVIIPITLNALASAAIPIFNATGNPQLYFRVRVVSLVANALPMILLIPTYGAYGVVYSMLIASLVVNVTIFTFIHRLIKLDWEHISSSLGIITISTLFPFILSRYALEWPFTSHTSGFLCIGAVMSGVYMGMIILFGIKFHHGPYETYLIIVQSFWKRKSGQER